MAKVYLVDIDRFMIHFNLSEDDYQQRLFKDKLSSLNDNDLHDIIPDMVLSEYQTSSVEQDTILLVKNNRDICVRFE